MSSWDEYPLAGRLRVEEPVGVFRLLEREAVGEKALERELAACNETRAFFLADSAERPRGVDRELPPEHVLADVERRLVAFAHEADAPPGRGLRTAATRASGLPVQSIDASTPSPWVSARSAVTGSVSFALITVSAPSSRASVSRSGTTSIAITRAPIARPSIVAERPTGPWPKTARVSRPETSRRLSAP